MISTASRKVIAPANGWDILFEREWKDAGVTIIFKMKLSLRNIVQNFKQCPQRHNAVIRGWFVVHDPASL